MYRVLLADDEQIERMALARRLMRRFGDSLQISEATDGKEAVELYQKEHSQIIIMDISMPELNGVEAAEQIRSMDEDCVIVFLTAYDEFSYAKRAIVIRALDYLLKPCDEEELAAVMEEAMRLTDKAVHNKENPTGNGAGMTEAEKEAEKRREQWPWNPDAEAPKDPETERMNQVAENITAEIPDVMVENQARQYLDNFKANISRQFPYEEYKKMTGMDDAKLLEEAKEPALRQVKMDLATAAIIKAENIEASDEDVEAEFAKMAEQFGMDVEMVKKYLSKEQVHDQILTQKAVAVVVDSATAEKPAKKTAKKAETAEGEEKKPAKKTTKKAETAEGEEKPKKAPAKKAAKKEEKEAE